MHILGTFFAISAGIFFGFIGPITKMAYNLGASIGIAIILRYLTASILITPIILINKPSIEIYKKEIWMFIIFTVGSILLTIGLLLSVKYIEVSLAILIFSIYPIIVLIISIYINKEKIYLNIKLSFFFPF